MIARCEDAANGNERMPGCKLIVRWPLLQAVRIKALGVLLISLTSPADEEGRNHRKPVAGFWKPCVYPHESRPDFDAYRLGLSHFEVRSYPALKRHLLITQVRHLFLARQTQRLRGEKSGVDSAASPRRDRRTDRVAAPLPGRSQVSPRTHRPHPALPLTPHRPSPHFPHENPPPSPPRPQLTH